MSKHPTLRRRPIAVFAVLALPAHAVAQNYQIPECFRPSPTAAAPTTVLYHDCLVTDGFVASAETDKYVFWGEAGDLLRVVIDGQWNDFDAYFEVFQPGDSVALISKFCGAPSYSTCSVSESVTLQVTGLHVLLVSDSGVDNSGNYDLGLHLLPDRLPSVGLSPGQSLEDAIQTPVDSDFLRFEATAGDLVEIKLDGLSNDFDATFIVRGPGGATVDTASCSAPSYATCSTSKQFTILESGTHTIEVFDSGWDNTGNYRISQTCIFLDCPDTGRGLSTSSATLSVQAGGQVAFALDAGDTHAGQNYLLLGSSAGFRPGTPLDGVFLPLNSTAPGLEGWGSGDGSGVIDPLLEFMLLRPGTPPFAGNQGLLDGQGMGTAQLDLPPSGDPALVGLAPHFAFLTIDIAPELLFVDFISNAVRVDLVP